MNAIQPPPALSTWWSRGAETALDRAYDREYTEIADLLRKHGGKTAEWFKAEESIQIAVLVLHKQAVEQHLAAGANVNMSNEDGNTLLHLAINSRGEDHGGCEPEEIIELLIANGADVNVKNNSGRTPLDYFFVACKMSDILIKHGGKSGEELKAEDFGCDSSSVYRFPDSDLRKPR